MGEAHGQVQALSGYELVETVLKESKGNVEPLLRLSAGEETDWLELKGTLVPATGTPLAKGYNLDDYHWHVARALIAFANTSGGAIIVGIDDKGKRALDLRLNDPRGFLQREGFESFMRNVVENALFPSNHAWHCQKEGRWTVNTTLLRQQVEPRLCNYEGQEVLVLLVKPLDIGFELLAERPNVGEYLLVRRKGDAGWTERLYRSIDQANWRATRSVRSLHFAQLLDKFRAEARYFPIRRDREVLEEVIREFPYPLAQTYAHLQQEMDRQEPLAATWQLKDAWECAVRFAAILAFSELLQSDTESTRIQRGIALIFKTGGPSLLDWYRLLELSCGDCRHGANTDAGAKTPAAELASILFDRDGNETELAMAIAGANGFAQWERQVFGQGVFQQERDFYAKETLSWLPALHAFYRKLHPLLQSWELMSRTEEGQEIRWQGANPPDFQVLRRFPISGPPTLLTLQHRGPPLYRIPLGPLLSVQWCALCGEPAVFFFLENHFQPETDRHRTRFSEYLKGHERDWIDWEETLRLAGMLPAEYRWERDSYTADDLAGIGILFRDFEREYLRPDHLADAIWKIVRKNEKGYIYISGSGGVGKTYLIRGLQGEALRYNASFLVYHIQAGKGADYRTFIPELQAAAREAGVRTQEIQTRKAESRSELQSEFADFMTKLKEVNAAGPLILAIDGIDELAETDPKGAVITSLLPEPALLPRKCFVLLAGRVEQVPTVRTDLDRLSRQSVQGIPTFWTLTIGPEEQASTDLLRKYLWKWLPEAQRNEGAVQAVIERSKGIFLYTSHYCRALQSGLAGTAEALPDLADFYSFYLARLKEKVGEHLFDSVHLPILMLLCAVCQPVTARQLEMWGVPGDRLRFALLDLRDFLKTQLGPTWNEALREDGERRYSLAHEDFQRFTSASPNLSAKLQEAHRKIARTTLGSQHEWAGPDPGDATLVYGLLFLPAHARLGELGFSNEREALAFSRACLNLGTEAWNAGRYHISLALQSNSQSTLGLLVGGGHSQLAGHLASALINQGLSLHGLKRPGEAIVCYDEAIRTLENMKDFSKGELKGEIASALVKKGVSLQTLGRLRESLACCEEAIAAFRALVEKGQRELAGDLASALVNKGISLRCLGRLNEAATCYDEAISIFRDLVDDGRAEFAVAQASAVMNKGVTLKDLGRLKESIACYDEAISTLKILVESGRRELAGELASAVMNKGVSLRELRRLDEAIDCYDTAIPMLRELVDGGRRELTGNLASALTNKGASLQDRGEPKEAVTCYNEAITMLKALVDGGLIGLARDLASVLTNKGVSLDDLGRWEEAIACYDETISIHKGLTEIGKREPVKDSASALVNKGVSLWRLGRLREALACYDEAIAMLRGLMDDGCREVAGYLASALVDKGISLRDLGLLAEAITCYEEAIAIRRTLAHDGNQEAAKGLASALVYKAVCLRGLGRLEESSVCYDEAIAIRKLLVYSGRCELSKDVAMALINKGVSVYRLGLAREAVNSYDEAISILRTLIDGGRKELANDLASALVNKGTAQRALGLLQEVVACYDEAIAIRQNLVDGGRRELASDLVSALVNKGASLDDLGQSQQAVACYDRAIALGADLADDGPQGLAKDVAIALMNKGVSLYNLERPAEAIACYDDAMTMLRHLAASGEQPVSKHLATALRNRALIREELQKIEGASEDYKESIQLWEELAKHSHRHRPTFLKTVEQCLAFSIQTGQWDSASCCLQVALRSISEKHRDERNGQEVFARLMHSLRKLADRQLQQIFERLEPEERDRLKQLLD